MVRPTKPKELKPKAEGAEGEAKASGGAGGMKLIIVNALVTIVVCFLFLGSNYMIVQNTISTAMSKMGVAGEEGEEAHGEEEEAVERGPILDLGEFILNLSDPGRSRYLKVNVALELTRKETDPHPEPAGGGGGHGGGHGAPADPMAAIEGEMNQFKPAIRDAVISVLSSKTADELLSQEGKEQSKEQLKEAVNGIFAGEREVIRVSFGNFIVQ